MTAACLRAGYKCRLAKRPLFPEGSFLVQRERVVHMETYQQHGLYIIKDAYFSDFPRIGWTANKNENRPYYYAWRDKSGILWMIPLTSQVENCKRKIEREERKRGAGNCIYYHIGCIAGRERGFKISDMFPVIDEYILRSYTIGQYTPYIVKTKSLNAALYSKSMRYLKLVETGKIRDQLGILPIKRILMNRIKNNCFVI